MRKPLAQQAGRMGGGKGLRWALRFIEACLFLIGLAGIPGDLAQWLGWLTSIDSNAARWLFVVVGLALVVVSEIVIPRMMRLSAEERILNAARLVLAEYERLKGIYQHEEAEPSNPDAASTRDDLRAAVNVYFRAATSVPDTETRSFHTSQATELREALGFEVKKYPMGLVAFAEPIGALTEWLDRTEAEENLSTLRELVKKGDT